MRDFDHFYEECQRYKETHGDLYIPALYVIDGYRLGDKVHSIRRGLIRVDDKQRQMLNDLGFVWKVRHDYSFAEVFWLLTVYKAKFGHVNIPLDYVTKSGIPLGRILRNIRNHWKKISEVEAQRLKDIGIILEDSKYEPTKHLGKEITRKVRGHEVKPSYEVIRFTGVSKEIALDGLERLVNDKMCEGYFPSGGISLEYICQAYIACQAVILID